MGISHFIEKDDATLCCGIHNAIESLRSMKMLRLAHFDSNHCYALVSNSSQHLNVQLALMAKPLYLSLTAECYWADSRLRTAHMDSPSGDWNHTGIPQGSINPQDFPLLVSGVL